ncbi:ribonuclease Z [Paenibacillus psychroresistens]|uniref:Ribonuclease Z n=1 Tax=Paenibacillus psychroresistens TaxID=1778678 RepID=A0A6B8RK95_9BACL|nr:ribonuclease Z [Paenibacillus psychroresistens]QGQ96700.1 ribonuclease Z [Paenibacillus psychroresistens]
MELVFLGTGAGTPSRQRNVTAIALDLLAENGAYWLFDCGEGTQQQILRSSIKLSKLDKLFVTHLHGDHIFGIPGLLSTRANQGGITPFTVFGPPGIQAFIDSALSVSQSRLNYPLEIIEINDGLIYEDDLFRVEALHVEHRIECFGYRFIELNRPGKLEVKKLNALKIASGPVFGRLKQGETVILEDGTVLNGRDFIGPEIKGRKIAIIGDTRRCEAAVQLALEVDIMVHEATFAVLNQDLANEYFHSTTVDAAQTAAEAGAKALILTHFSSRYQEEHMSSLLTEAQTVFEAVYLAADFSSYSIPLL